MVVSFSQLFPHFPFPTDANIHPALQFQLTVTTDSESYEETEIIYNPLFNEQRDKELLDLLPDYLTEEICFPRNQAPKFYMKVVDSMSKKIVLEED
jgi:hypothetical protein